MTSNTTGSKPSRLMRSTGWPLLVQLSLLLLLVVDLALIANAALAAISIDLGSQYIKIGIVKPGVPMEIVLNKESRRKTPFAIAIRNGERFFSDSAAQMAIKQPANTFTSFLDLVGKQFENPLVQRYQQKNPHLTLVKDEKRGTVLFDIPEEGKFSVESLLAMLLWNAKEQSEAHAGQPIKDAVITIPAYFNQAERKAVAVAAQIAGLNLLQLLSSGSAAGLNYGVFRRKEIKEQAQTLLIYDVGAGSTVATIVEYRLAKEGKGKGKGNGEQYPVISTLGVGYDRQLGGDELTLRLREHLASEFKKAHKLGPGKRFEENARAMAKLQKEAERVKMVLSANTEHFAQVESLFEDRDLKVKVTRELLHEMLAPLEVHYLQPVRDALKMAEMQVAQVDMVVLMGAGTRIPRLQEVLQDFVGKELGRFLNTDEAVALGGVYQAAHLSKGFKVMRFDVEELQIYPVQATFPMVAKEGEISSSSEEARLLNRPIYGYKSHYPAAKKLISFTSAHKDDFSFNLNYGSLDHLSAEQLEQFGPVNISEVAIRDVKSTLQSEMSDEDATYKGIKVHFELDPFGVVRVDQAELIVERMEKPSNSTISNIVGKIGELFSSGSEKEEKKKGGVGKIDLNEDLFKDIPPLFGSEEESGESSSDKSTSTTQESTTAETSKEGESSENREEPKKEEEQSEDGVDKSGEDGGKPKKKDSTEKEAGAADKEGKSSSGGSSKGEEAKSGSASPSEKPAQPAKPPKPKVVKAPLKLVVDNAFYDLEKDDVQATSKLLAEFEKREREKAERDATLNSLESAVYDLGSKLEEAEFTRYGTAEELEAAGKVVAASKAWLEDEVGVETKTEEIKAKRKELDASIKKLKYRKKQSEERVKHIEQLEKVLNETTTYVDMFKNLTGGTITEVELATMERVAKESTDWWKTKREEQEKLKDNEDPAFTWSEVRDKTNALDREIKYLFNKMVSAQMKAEAEAKKLKEEEEKKKKAEKPEKEEASETTPSGNETESTTNAEEKATAGGEERPEDIIPKESKEKTKDEEGKMENERPKNGEKKNKHDSAEL